MRSVTVKQAGVKRHKLHGSHVVEGMVQLLADGFVLQFLGVQLIYWVGPRSEGSVQWRKSKGGEGRK